MILRRSAHKKR